MFASRFVRVSVFSFHGFSHESVVEVARKHGAGYRIKDSWRFRLFSRRDKTCFDIIAPSFSSLLPRHHERLIFERIRGPMLDRFLELFRRHLKNIAMDPWDG